MEDLSNKVTGDQLTASQWNQSQQELINLITQAGLAPSSGDLQQVIKSLGVITNLTTFFTAGGTPDTITLSSLVNYHTVTSYTDGTKVRWTPTADNIGVVTLNLNGLGPKNLVQSGSPLTAGALKQDGFAEATYVASTDNFVLNSSSLPVASTTVEGISRFATHTEVSTPLGEDSITVSPESLSLTSGFYELSSVLTAGDTTSSSTMSDVTDLNITMTNTISGFFTQGMRIEGMLNLTENAGNEADVDLALYEDGVTSATCQAHYYYSDNSTGNMVYAGRTINGSTPGNTVNIPSSAYNGSDILVTIVGYTSSSDPTDILKLSWASTDNSSTAALRFGGHLTLRKLTPGTP